jgi:hypothetical protein
VSKVVHPLPDDAGFGEWLQSALYPWLGRPEWWPPEPDDLFGLKPQREVEPG